MHRIIKMHATFRKQVKLEEYKFYRGEKQNVGPERQVENRLQKVVRTE